MNQTTTKISDTSSNKIVERLESYFERLWSINRSIAGPGIRESMDILSEIIPTERLKFDTGSKIFDWTVPNEWVAHEAYFVDPNGVKHAELKNNNLHLMGYSVPFKGTIRLDELCQHLYSLPGQPEAIPYVTSYYKENWGFCISHNEHKNLPDGEYQVYIDSEQYPGAVEIGEAVLCGLSEKEVLFSTYLCHPSMANNELSGPLAMAFLYDCIKGMSKRYYTYRFLLSAETIGTICYLSKRGQHLKDHLAAGYVMTCLGDSGAFTYKLSRRANTVADRAAQIVLRDSQQKFSVIPFNPGSLLSGKSDETQYCSPGFNLPVGSLMRTMYGAYPEYHTSLDNKEFISFEALAGSVEMYYSLVKALESNNVWENTVKYCVPQLSPRGLYPSVSRNEPMGMKIDAMLWLLNLADGQHDLLETADKSGHKMEYLASIAEELSAAGLIKLISRE